MGKVYIIEYRSDNKSIASNTVEFFTGQKYTHTAMFIDKYFCELDATDETKNEPDYHIYDYQDIDNFLLKNNESKRTEAFEVPRDFSEGEIMLMLRFWREKEMRNIKYGWGKLFRFIWLSNMDIFLKSYYNIFKKPYKPVGDTDRVNVCSEAVGLCLQQVNYWISQTVPYFNYLCPETTYPGIYAKALSAYKHKPKS